MKLWMVSFISIIILPHFVQARTILESVDTRFEGQTFVAELEFNKEPIVDDVLVEYINQTIQVNIPSATVRAGKYYNKVNSNNIKSVYSYQFSKDLLRTRIIYENVVTAANFEGFVKINKQGKKIQITVMDPKSLNVAKSIDFEAVPPVDLDAEFNKSINQSLKNVTPAVASAKMIVAKELNIPDKLPAKKMVKEKMSKVAEKAPSKLDNKKIKKQTLQAKVSKEKLEEKDIPLFKKQESVEKVEEASSSRLIYSLLVVAIFSAGLLVFAKWWNKNHKVNDNNTKIQVLTQHHLGPKKSLAIVRVAGESILLGVTDQNINMIKTLSFIDDEVMEEIPQSFVGALQTEEAKPEAEKQEQKITYSPDLDLVSDLRKQVAGKLQNLRNI